MRQTYPNSYTYLVNDLVEVSARRWNRELPLFDLVRALSAEANPPFRRAWRT